jgi:hypothetical protein
LAERNRNSFLVKLLKDVTEKGHTLAWADTRTVNELEKPMIGFQGYISHDSRPSPHPRQAADDDDFDDSFEIDLGLGLDDMDLNYPPSERAATIPRAESQLQPARSESTQAELR